MGITKKESAALEAEGWKVGTVDELLDLSDEDMLFIEMKIALAKALQEKRKRKRLTQTQLARLCGSGQGRIAKMERGDASLDLMVRSLLAMGASPREIGRKLSGAKRHRRG
jgi:hypothetical protein